MVTHLRDCWFSCLYTDFDPTLKTAVNHFDISSGFEFESRIEIWLLNENKIFIRHVKYIFKLEVELSSNVQNSKFLGWKSDEIQLSCRERQRIRRSDNDK